MRSLYRILTLGLALTAAGCFQIEQHISLDRDLSGTADFRMTMDMETMVPVIASMNRAFSGKQGPPTEEDMQQAREELREGMEADVETEEPDLEEMRRDLPGGVRLLDARFAQDDLVNRIGLDFAFDHLRDLTEVSFAEKDGGKGRRGGPPEEEDPAENPFGNIEIVEEGNTLVIRSVNPVEEVSQQQEQMGGAGMTQGMGEAMEAMFQGMRVVFTLEAPFDVVEHNATRVEGHRLVWEYDADDFEGAMEGRAAPDEGIFVRYRK